MIGKIQFLPLKETLKKCPIGDFLKLIPFIKTNDTKSTNYCPF
ncbi:hypothetical protein MNB_SUP05-SYMBIONT-5-1166 [hydrothermal vent metagenome]|uniref:Uncharacterized protein n=1 Tax=hydrothermal vent metagenome TaxID=652676 RepID=A0A1W1E1V5_9ZZZZ